MSKFILLFCYSDLQPDRNIQLQKKKIPRPPPKKTPRVLSKFNGIVFPSPKPDRNANVMVVEKFRRKSCRDNGSLKNDSCGTFSKPPLPFFHMI